MFRAQLVHHGPSLAELARRQDKGLVQVTKDNGDDLKATGRRRVKVRTGKTQGSIEVRMRGPYEGELLAKFGGKFLEYGTRKMAAQPWARPALEEVRPRALERVRQVVREASK